MTQRCRGTARHQWRSTGTRRVTGAGARTVRIVLVAPPRPRRRRARRQARVVRRAAGSWRRGRRLVAAGPQARGGGTRPGHAIPLPIVSINSTPVQYKGDDLDPERGPGLGCFRFQLIVLGIFIVLTPLTVAWQWPDWISAALLFAVVILLLITGQTIIFLLRLVAADRRSRRRPLGSATKTVGELEDAVAGGEGSAADGDDAPPPSDEEPVRQ